MNSEITSAATWIAEVERERRSIERDLGRKPTPRKHTKNEIKALVRQLKDIVGTLADADPEDKRAIYDELGVNLTYHQDGRVHVAAGCACTQGSCRRGDLNPHALTGTRPST